MSFLRVAGLSLSPAWKSRLQRAGISTVHELTMRSDIELSETLDVSLAEAQQLCQAVAMQVVEPPKTAFELWQAVNSSGPVLALSDDAQAQALRIHPGLTELVGPAGVGKTQCCFTLAVQAYMLANGFLPSASDDAASSSSSSLPPAHIIWLDTESTFSADRLLEVATHRFPHHFSSPAAVTALLSCVLVLKASSSSQLLSLLSKMEETVITHRCCLLLLDSVASPVRHEYGRADIAARQSLLAKIASQLKLVSEKLNVACCVTNQVMTRWGRGAAGGEGGGRGGAGGELTAALGVTWAHAVNTRWVLEDEEGGAAEGRRRLRVAKTPLYAGCAFRYTVTDAGVVVGDRLQDDDTDDWNVLGMSIRKELDAGEAREEQQTARLGGNDAELTGGFYASDET